VSQSDSAYDQIRESGLYAPHRPGKACEYSVQLRQGDIPLSPSGRIPGRRVGPLPGAAAGLAVRASGVKLAVRDLTMCYENGHLPR